MSEIMLRHSPPSWKLERIGQLFEERREKVSDKDYPPLSVTKNGVVPQMENVAKTDDGDNRKLVRRGDFVINSRSDRRGSSGLAEQDGSVSVINIVLKPRHGDPRFLHYLLKSYAFQEEFYRYGHGIVADLWTTRMSDMKGIRVALPDIPTQKAIADFLDRETARIDQLIEKKQRLVELLRQRYLAAQSDVLFSGIRVNDRTKGSVIMLPNYRNDWAKVRLKFLFRRVSRPILDTDEVVTAFRDGRVTARANRREDGFTFAEKEIGYQGVEPGDLVIHAMDAFAGAIGVSDSRGKCSPVCSIAVPLSPGAVDARFWAYYLRGLAKNGFINSLSKGIRERSTDFRWGDASNLLVNVPDLHEQKRISDLLDDLADWTLTTSDSTLESIARLREIRSSMITAAVIGQIDVADGYGIGDSTPLERALRREGAAS